MKSAHDRYTGGAQFLREVVGLQDQVARAFDRAEQGQRHGSQHSKVAARGDGLRRTLAEAGLQDGRITRIVKPEAANLHCDKSRRGRRLIRALKASARDPARGAGRNERAWPSWSSARRPASAPLWPGCRGLVGWRA